MLNIVSTPIGNLDDISIRQAKTLASSDIILAEDTRSAVVLLNACRERFNFKNKEQKIISYFKEKEFEKLPEIISFLEQGKNISLISESGTPLISDPGYLIVKTCIKRNIPVTVVPGPSALISSILLSGFNPLQFMYLGFLPKKENEKIKLFKKLVSIKEIFPEAIFIFYESPRRIKETLQCFITLDWSPDTVICRELTKKFEEVVRGKPISLINRQYKGEITLVIK